MTFQPHGGVVRTQLAKVEPSDAEDSANAKGRPRRAVSFLRPATGGFHAAMIIKATEPGASTCAAALPLVASIVFLLVQCVAMLAVGEESSHPRCSAHDQCQTGDWCAPTEWDSIEPGRCYDCFTASPLLHEKWDELSESWNDARRSAAGEEWLRAAVAHCNRTDTMPDRCDHLVERQSRIAAEIVFVLLFITVLIVLPLAEDWDEAALDMCLFDHRTTAADDPEDARPRRDGAPAAIRGLTWCCVRTRLFVLPIFILFAVCGLLLSQPATATNFLLNGLAISFATTVDNHVAHFCLSPREREEVDAALALVADGAGSDGTDAAAWADAKWQRNGWRFNRVYAATCAAIIVALNVAPEPFMSAFGTDEGPNAGTPCGTILDAAWWLPLCSILVVSVAWSLAINRRHRIVTLKDATAALLDAFLTVAYMAGNFGGVGITFTILRGGV